jgi:membrane-bound metal-dependent hydrolase YbcI (DUF457 family)
MPSPFGHALAGLAIGAVATPASASASGPFKHLYTVPLLAATVAALPDADLVMPYFHRMATHSVTGTAAVIILTMIVTGQVTGRVSWRLVLTLGAAHASHLLLDWLGADPGTLSGLQIFWPFSHAFYISGWDLFPPTERRLFGNPNALAINTRAFFAELTMLGPIAGAAWFVMRRRRSRDRTSVRDARPRPCA